MAKGAKRDPLARRHGETHWTWRSRLAEQVANDAKKGESIVTAETLAQGGLEKADVVDDDGRQWRTVQRKTRSALAHMHSRGNLSDGQYLSALQIARVVERLERSVTVGCASMEARVDCSGSSGDTLVESLYDVRLERAYSEWRKLLPMPKRMILDMVTVDHRLSAIAARHNTGWPRAQRLLRNALEQWPECFARQMREIDQEDVDAAHKRVANKTWA